MQQRQDNTKLVTKIVAEQMEVVQEIIEFVF
jgi:hypothetical protein